MLVTVDMDSYMNVTVESHLLLLTTRYFLIHYMHLVDMMQCRK